MDPLQDVLSVVGATSYLSTRMTAGGTWAVRFEAPEGVKFNSVRRGRCRLRVDGAEPITLTAGDCFLLTRPRAFVLASAPAGHPVSHPGDNPVSGPAGHRVSGPAGGPDNGLDRRPVPAAPIFAAPVDGVARVNEGDDVFLIGGGFRFNERARTVLLANLPPVLHVPASEPEAESVRGSLRRIESELDGDAFGAVAVAEHLALVMLIEVLRLHLSRHPGDVTGWLAGLSDPAVAAVLRAMHERPGHPWTVAELAAVSSISRSALAARFKRVVGQGPLEYLTGWRIELASQRLRDGGQTLDRIARDVGYGSESALSTAFKRVVGSSPREYRRAHIIGR